MSEAEPSVTVGRYLLHRQIARGGMATIHIARLMGDVGFSRIVAAKRLLPELAEDSEFVAMFMDEARIASKVHHKNVVPVLDLVTTADEVMLVQEYVHGVPLHTLLRTAHHAKQHIPARIAVSIATQVLAGLHAAHETTDEVGTPLHIVHRDVSPQNVMVSTDGSGRLLDFGVAKATMAAHVSRSNTFKGKLAYSAPEQLEGNATRQSDVYALAVVLWELLVGHRLHGTAKGEAELIANVKKGKLPSIRDALASEAESGAIDRNEWKQIEKLDPVVNRGLAVDLDTRWKTAAEMERALLEAVTAASVTEVAAWVKSLGKDFLEGRDKVIAAEEQSWRRAQGTAPGHSEPGSPRIATVPGTVRTDAKLPPEAPPPGRWKVIAAVFGVLVLLLGGGFALAMYDASSPHPAKSAATRPAPLPEPPPAPTAAVVEAPAPQTTAVVETQAEPTPPERAATIRHRAPVHVTAKPPEPDPEPVAAPAPAPEPAADDCSTPYYYEGSKKVFKPNCI
jgi:serine/threonine-protein kinase